MEKYSKINNLDLISLHLHNGSVVDKHANLRNEQTFRYLQKLNVNVAVAIQNHEDKFSSMELYYLAKNHNQFFDNKIYVFPAMENNISLNEVITTSEKSVALNVEHGKNILLSDHRCCLKQAHFGAFADASSEKGIENWENAKELNAYCRIINFALTEPDYKSSIKKIIGLCCKNFQVSINNKQIRDELNKNDLVKNENMAEDIICHLLKSTKKFWNLSLEEIKSKLENTLFDDNERKVNLSEIFKETGVSAVNVGQNLFVARNLINRKLGVNIPLSEIESLLNGNETQQQIQSNFLSLVRNYLRKDNKSFHELSDKKIISILYRPIFINDLSGKRISILSAMPFEGNGELLSGNNLLSLDEYSKMVHDAGGYVCLNHPQSVLGYHKNAEIPLSLLQQIDLTKYYDKEKIEKMKAEDKGKILSQEEIGTGSNYKNFLLKLELLFTSCNNKNIKIDAIELPRFTSFEDWAKQENTFPEKLLEDFCDFASGKGLKISYGSDEHLNKLHLMYCYYKKGLMDEQTYQEMIDKSIKQSDKLYIGDYRLLTEKITKENGGKAHFTDKIVSCDFLSLLTGKIATSQLIIRKGKSLEESEVKEKMSKNF